MGSCFDKKGRNAEDGKDSLAERPIEKMTSSLLVKYLQREVIVEEDSQLRASCVSALENQSHESSAIITSKHRFKEGLLRNRQLGEDVRPNRHVTIKNQVTGRYLHSHALKCHSSKLYDVCSCSEGGHEHDWWTLQVLGDELIRDGNILTLQHKLTKAYLRSNKTISTPRTKLQAVGGGLRDTDEEQWLIEFLNARDVGLQINSLFRLRHVATEGYLHTGKNHGQVHDYFEVSVCFKNDAKDVWLVESQE